MLSTSHATILDNYSSGLRLEFIETVFPSKPFCLSSTLQYFLRKLDPPVHFNLTRLPKFLRNLDEIILQETFHEGGYQIS